MPETQVQRRRQRQLKARRKIIVKANLYALQVRPVRRPQEPRGAVRVAADQSGGVCRPSCWAGQA